MSMMMLLAEMVERMLLCIFSVATGLVPRAVSIAECCFAASSDTGKTTDAVGVAHKIGARYIDVHRAGACALSALATACCIFAYTEDAHNTPQPLACASCAEVVAEGPVDEKADNEKE